MPELRDVERRYGVVSGVTVDTLDTPRVVHVEEGSLAAAAGLRAGDVLRDVVDRAIREGIDFSIALVNRCPGDRLRLRVAREGRDIDLAEESARRPGLRDTSGVVVQEVLPESAAEEAGLRRGDIILSLGRRYVHPVEDLGEILDHVPEGATAQIRILRVEQGRKVQRSGPVMIR